MKRISTLVVGAALVSVLSMACDQAQKVEPTAEVPQAAAEAPKAAAQAKADKPAVAAAVARAEGSEPKVVTPTALSLELKKDKPPTVFDANGEATRKKFGVVPGAKLLESSSGYELSALPKDKSDSLVFYCANTHCSAAEGAAERATKAGHTNVAVMPEGIKGWKAAGLPTNQI